MTYTFSGEGPGVQTADGCSVSLYRDLPYMGELEEVIEHFKPDLSVLELGCGTGRLCTRILDAGCRVTGVDESSEMLACLPGQVTGVRASIEGLDLGRAFDIVLLASHLINHPDAKTRDAFVLAARRHLQAGGLLLLKRHSVQWLLSARVGPAGSPNGSSVFVEGVSRRSGVVSMTLRYELGGQTWRHSFSTSPLEESEVEAQLTRFGFRIAKWYGSQRLWVLAVAGDA